MSYVSCQVRPGRQWVMEIRRIPPTASTVRHCSTRFLAMDRAETVAVGSLLAEKHRSFDEVTLSIVLPSESYEALNCYFLPLRSCAHDGWLLSAKPFLRSLLNLPVSARLIRAASLVANSLRASANSANSNNYRRADYLDNLAARLALGGDSPETVTTVTQAFDIWVEEMALALSVPEESVHNQIHGYLSGRFPANTVETMEATEPSRQTEDLAQAIAEMARSRRRAGEAPVRGLAQRQSPKPTAPTNEEIRAVPLRYLDI